jgi:hypothetical protein
MANFDVANLHWRWHSWLPGQSLAKFGIPLLAAPMKIARIYLEGIASVVI